VSLEHQLTSYNQHRKFCLPAVCFTAGYKFDMRIYVAATCFDPLRCFVYTDGLARFATEAYSGDKSDLK
jgi:hypothetical protein